MTNTINLIRGEQRYSDSEFNGFQKGETLWGRNGEDYSEPAVLKSWPIEKEEEAKAELAKYRCEYYDNWAIEYGLEYFEANEDGEFVEGSDYEIAETKEVE